MVLALLLLCCGVAAVIASDSLRGVSSQEKQQIVDLHNYYRNLVAGGGLVVKDGTLRQASNMAWMDWDEDLAAAAQDLSDSQVFEHDLPATGKYPQGSYGQNLFTSSRRPTCAKTNWTEAITAWFNEHQVFETSAVPAFHSPTVKGDVWGHFAQMVWATTNKVGCGHSRYREGPWCTHLYTCNYFPPGNVRGRPMCIPGTPCKSGNATFPNLCRA